MKRNRTMAIAVAMALTLAAFIGAASASANVFKSEAEPTKWSGSVIGKAHKLSLVGDTFDCTAVPFSGETTMKSSSKVTVAPKLEGCTHSGFANSWATNGCKFRFHPGAGPALTGTLDIVGCEAPMLNVTGGCVTEIGNQLGLGPVTYKNVAAVPSTVTMIANLNNLTFTRSNGCPAGNGTFHTGSYTGEWTVKGTIVSGGFPTGISVESVVTTETGLPSNFAAEEAPVTITGSNWSEKALSFGSAGYMWCKSYTYSGSSASKTPETLTLNPSYHSCTWYDQNGSVALADENISRGECSYVLGAEGAIAIAGANCASKPMTITKPGCTVTVGPQSSSPGLFYTNQGTYKLRTVKREANTPLTFTATGASCFEAGTFSTGINWHRVTLAATNAGGSAQGFWLE